MITQSLPSLCNANLEVPLATGGTHRYINLDNTASTSPLEVVARALDEVVPWYSSVHRGTGFASQVSTTLYENARHAVGTFVGARATDTVVFVRNTTEALNLLTHCIPFAADDVVLSTSVEHHANMLPWRRVATVIALPPPPSPAELITDIQRTFDNTKRHIAVVTITGASNVTGEVFPLREIADIAHKNGALFVVDAAQLAPHRAIDMADIGIDCIAFSGHKMYAPYGTGALVLPTSLAAKAEPLLAGGGAIDLVTLDDVSWTSPPDRLEAGSPNVLGAIAMGTAATALQGVGMDTVASHESDLLTHARPQLMDIPGITMHSLWNGPDIDRLGVATFSLEGTHHALLAAILSAEYAIGVRHGCFCAHPYVTHLLGIGRDEMEAVRSDITRGDKRNVPGAVRASFGIGTTREDIDHLTAALRHISENGPELEYAQDRQTGDFMPRNDNRPFPVFVHSSF